MTILKFNCIYAECLLSILHIKHKIVSLVSQRSATPAKTTSNDVANKGLELKSRRIKMSRCYQIMNHYNSPPVPISIIKGVIMSRTELTFKYCTRTNSAFIKLFLIKNTSSRDIRAQLPLIKLF